MTDSMGMIQVDGVTYRIVHLGGSGYEVVRLLDDVCLGGFRRERASLTSNFSAGEHSLRHIARIAVRQGKTKWHPTTPSSWCKGFAVEQMATIASYFWHTRPKSTDPTGSRPSIDASAPRSARSLGEAIAHP